MLDSLYTSPTYNSYYPDISSVDAAIAGLAGAYDISRWEALETTITVSSLTVVAGVATVVTPISHGYLSGQEILISGAIPAGLNGLQTITVTSATEFTYGTLEPDVVATGVITSTYSDDVTKENLILAATKDLNSFDFLGAINPGIISPNNMKFPRLNLYYPNGVKIGDTEIPPCVLDYIAIRITERLANVESGQIYDGRIKRQRIGKLEQEFHNPKDTIVIGTSLNNYPSYQCIADYISGISANGNIKYVKRT